MNRVNTVPYSLVLIVLVNVFRLCETGGEEEGPYRGKYLGKLNSYHHQVSGDVYAVDDYTLLLIQFSYDGNGADTFFWAGSSNRPGPQGFIVPDEHGKTNVLERYFNKDLTITLPDKKKIVEIKWFAIYDLSSQNTFGDIYIPEEFEPPALQKISALSTRSRGVRSESVEVIDSKSIRLPEFSFDGTGKAYFWVGVGPQPASKGFKVPDEYGYLDNLRAYHNEDITLELPGDLTIFDIDWFSIFDIETNENCGSVIIPDGLSVPPSLIEIVHHRNSLPNCEQLHKNFQVSWEIFGPQITIQLAGQVEENDYMAFGLSGSPDKSQMLGADVTIAYIDVYRGYAADYNISSFSPCARVLGQYKGVCKDEMVGGMDNNQLHTFTREDGLNIITYRRSLISPDSGDKVYPTESSVYVVWALGRLDHNKEPSFHDYYLKSDLSLELNRKEPENKCFAFTRSVEMYREPWEKSDIFDKNIRTFVATIGPSGGKRGYQGITGMTTSGLAWYINGKLIPELWMRRGLTYSFKVFGGNNPHSAETYHPMIVTTEPHGGLEQLTEAAQRHIRVLAGVEYTRRGLPRPTAAGPLCLWKHDKRDRRLDDDFETFKKFNRSLTYSCENGDPAILEVTPNTSWPDTVYYNSFTHINMGWKIHIVDNYNVRNGYLSTYSKPVILTLSHFTGRYFTCETIRITMSYYYRGYRASPCIAVISTMSNTPVLSISKALHYIPEDDDVNSPQLQFINGGCPPCMYTWKLESCAGRIGENKPRDYNPGLFFLIIKHLQEVDLTIPRARIFINRDSLIKRFLWAFHIPIITRVSVPYGNVCCYRFNN